jgi:hypothetical protein
MHSYWRPNLNISRARHELKEFEIGLTRKVTLYSKSAYLCPLLIVHSCIQFLVVFLGTVLKR